MRIEEGKHALLQSTSLVFGCALRCPCLPLACAETLLAAILLAIIIITDSLLVGDGWHVRSGIVEEQVDVEETVRIVTPNVPTTGGGC